MTGTDLSFTAGSGKEGEGLFCPGNPKNLITFKGGARRFTFLSSKKMFLRQVL